MGAGSPVLNCLPAELAAQRLLVATTWRADPRRRPDGVRWVTISADGNRRVRVIANAYVARVRLPKRVRFTYRINGQQRAGGSDIEAPPAMTP